MDPIAIKLLAFMMILTRISAFFLVVPVFSWQSIPVRIKISTCLLLSIFFYIVKTPVIETTSQSILEITLLLAIEAAYGLALAVITALIFGVVKLSGRIAERQMGMAMAQTVDPLTGERAQPLSMLLEMIFILIFLSANGHHAFLIMISKSYDAFAPGSTPDIATLTASVTQAGSVMFTAALRLSAPILAASLLLMVTFGVLARIAPEMNILFLSMPLRIGMGLFMTMVFLPFINGFVSEFAGWMNKLLPL